MELQYARFSRTLNLSTHCFPRAQSSLFYCAKPVCHVRIRPCMGRLGLSSALIESHSFALLSPRCSRHHRCHVPCVACAWDAPCVLLALWVRHVFALGMRHVLCALSALRVRLGWRCVRLAQRSGARSFFSSGFRRAQSAAGSPPPQSKTQERCCVSRWTVGGASRR